VPNKALLSQVFVEKHLPELDLGKRYFVKKMSDIVDMLVKTVRPIEQSYPQNTML